MASLPQSDVPPADGAGPDARAVRVPVSPTEQERRKAWGAKWGSEAKQASARLQTEGK